jgi:hypothetical protein
LHQIDESEWSNLESRRDTMATPDQAPTEDELFFPIEEGRRIFEREVRDKLDMSGEEFIHRWDAGEYETLDDVPENWHILRLSFLIPLGRQ